MRPDLAAIEGSESPFHAICSGCNFDRVPMYIDRHDTPGASPEQLAAAHLLDLEVQGKHGVKYHTYWFDPEDGTVFCLAEGPTKQAVVAVHQESHGMVASSVLEFDALTPLNAFMGSMPEHPAGTAYTAPAMRAIVFTDICGSVAQTQQLGDEGHMELLGEHNSIVRDELSRNQRARGQTHR